MEWATFKKTYEYEFIPTKAREQQVGGNNKTRKVVEIREDHPPTYLFDPTKWRIRKRLDSTEIATGVINFSHDQAFDHVFRYWALEVAREVVEQGKKVPVIVMDVTDENSPIRYGPGDESTFFKPGLKPDTYVLGLSMGMVQTRGFKDGDEIGLYWDLRNGMFHFKLFR